MNSSRFTDQQQSPETKTMVATSARIKGNLDSKTDVILDGEIEGNVKVEALLMVGKSGHVHGDVNAQNLIIEGNVEGNLIVHRKVEIRANGKVSGNIVCQQIAMADGAFYQGSVKMSDGNPISPTYFSEKRKDIQEKNNSNK